MCTQRCKKAWERRVVSISNWTQDPRNKWTKYSTEISHPTIQCQYVSNGPHFKSFGKCYENKIFRVIFTNTNIISFLPSISNNLWNAKNEVQLWFFSGVASCRCTWSTDLRSQSFLGSSWMGLNCRRSWCPTGWADFCTGFHKLKCLHQAEGFFHASAHWEIIDTQMLDDSIGVTYEKNS